MTVKEIEKKVLEEQLKNVKQRVEILNMIEEKLVYMRKLAQSVIDDDISTERVQNINKEINYLLEQVKLLEGEINRYLN